jgi:hypothetical protein
MKILDQYGKPYKIGQSWESPLSDVIAKRWAKQIYEEAKKTSYFHKFIGPLLVDQFGYRLTQDNVIPSTVAVDDKMKFNYKKGD